MNNQLGKILYVDPQQFQKSVNTDGLTQYFNEMHLTKQKDFLYLVESIFQNGSGNRSYFFMDMPFREYGAYVKGFEYYMPFFGVKGRIPGMTRILNYTELLTCKKEDLEGVGFSDVIFGTNYLKPEESMAASENTLISIIQQEKFRVSHRIHKEEISDAIMVLEKLWEAQEADPRTRFIIRMNDPENDSLGLLKRMYMLLPQGLRLQLGFETNISEIDLQLIHENSGIPIYVLTADQDAEFHVDQYNFPVVVFDYEKRESYTYNSTRLQILDTTAREMNDLNTVFLDYAEKKVMEDNKARYSSVKFYEDVVNRANDPANYWWKNENVDSVETLKAQYDDQRQLLNNDELYQEAMYSLLTRILPKSTLGPQMVRMVRDKNYPKRKELLTFLMKDLYQDTQLNAIDQMNKEVTAEKQQEIETLRRQYEAEKTDAVKEAVAKKDKEIKNVENMAYEEIESLKNQIESLQNSDSATDKKQLQKKAAREVAKAKSAANKMKIGCIVLGAVAAIAIVGAVVLGIGGNSAKKSLAETKQNVESLTQEKEDLAQQNETLTQERDQAVTDAQNLQAQLDAVDVKKDEAAAADTDTASADEQTVKDDSQAETGTSEAENSSDSAAADTTASEDLR